MNVRRTLAGLSAVGALVLLTGCGGPDTPDGAARDPASATSSPSAATSPSSGAPSTDPNGVAAAQVAGLLRTALDKATTAHISVALGGSVGAAQGVADLTGSSPKLAFTADVQALGGPIDLRIIDGTVYLNTTPLGKKFLSFSADAKDGPLGPLTGQLDPVQLFQRLGQAVSGATFDGKEEVDGERLDHYSVTLDSAKLDTQALGGGQLPATLTQEWWFDSQGRISRISGELGGAGGSLDLTFTDWGKPVHIEAPPADLVSAAG